MRSVLCALVLGLSALAAVPARAQSLADADAAFGRGEIDAAQQAYQAALQSGGLTGEDLVRAYLRAGVLAMWTGDEAESERNLRWALTLDPQLAPPPELSPAQQSAFTELRTAVAQADALAIEISGTDERSASVRVAAPSFAGLRVRAEATAEGASRPWSQIREAEPELELEVPATAWGAALTADVQVALLDPYGNTLRTAQTTLRRVASPADAPQDPEGSEAAPEGATSPDPGGGDGGDDTGLIVGVTLAVIAVLAGAGAGIGYAIWDAENPPSYNLIPAPSSTP